MSLGFPTSPSEVDAAWFTEAMRSTDMIGDGVEVTAFEAEPIGIGVGILGLLWRISLDYRGDSGPGTAVLKLPHTGAQSREIADAFRFYEREVGFYEQGAPRSPVRTPVRYASAFDVTSGDFVLLMEDVGDRRCYDQMAGCPPEEAARDLGVLAGHHAAWWESPDLDSLSWIVRMADPPNPQSLVPALRQSWPIIESQFGHLLRGPMFEAAKRMPDAVPALLERLGEAPATLLHGDHRLDNLFFSDDEGPDGVVMLDWQITGAGRAPYDVAYFLSQSLVPED
ncbi:MAG: phosphotransferase, partial [Acidimicrobiia bacterium]|nr:phosphotransferase [Acidimicrobiia bacterium]